MKYRLQREIEKLKKSILTLAALVEERLHVAIRSINQREKNIALDVINGDQEIDEMEVELEEECLKLLALH
ncbi:MAG: PhoU domain-containing protein, partial [bacterium]